VATGTIILNPGAAILPDNSASNLAPAVQRIKSSGSAPGVYFLQLAFDASNLEWACWQFRVPADYASALAAKLVWKMVSATTGNVILVSRLAAFTPGTDSTDFDAKVFATANTSAATAVPATTAGRLAETSITMTNDDSVAAGDFAVLYVARDGASGSDTAAGDLELVGVALTYTTT
jgi:hypothetical protein